MFNGTNISNKEFDVIDEEGGVLGSFNIHSDAVICGKSVPWYAGEIRIRRDDRSTTARRIDRVIMDCS